MSVFWQLWLALKLWEIELSSYHSCSSDRVMRKDLWRLNNTSTLFFRSRVWATKGIIRVDCELASVTAIHPYFGENVGMAERGGIRFCANWDGLYRVGLFFPFATFWFCILTEQVWVHLFQLPASKHDGLCTPRNRKKQEMVKSHES